MNTELYPLVVLEDLEKILKSIRSTCYNDLYSFKEQDSSENMISQFKAVNFAGFNFDLISVELSNSKSIIYTYEMNPWAETVNKKHSGKATSTQIIERFGDWVSLVKRYENLDFEDPILHDYETEIFEYLKILDTDADTEPFKIEQQVALVKYLDKIHKIAKKETPSNEDLIYSIEEAKILVTKEPKNKVMRRVSKILAKSRKSSMKLFKDFVDVLKKEIIKEALWSGFDKIEQLYTIMKNLPI
jgi:hypothetical protein